MPASPSIAEFQVFLGMPAIIHSQPMQKVMQMVERVAPTNAAVLITGESGTGKELIARGIHHRSLRCSKPWVDISCAALPEHLMESELFGYEKGAFSGAASTKPGLFELAHTGTLFLDEIGELDPKMQVKLLRVLDGIPYYRLGGTRKISADVRVIAATNQNLEELMQAGGFRTDLFHRISQIHLTVPPLRQRVEDIVPLAEFFLGQQNSNLRFSAESTDLLQRHSWPGNVRELRNAVIRASVLATAEVIEPIHLPGEVQAAPASGPKNLGTIDGMEREMIRQMLVQTGGHQQRAAALLGISRRTLSRKLKLYETEAASDVCARPA